ncbi:MAG: NAD(P)H-dependent oxidoreductase [Leptotrichiaceae bacterium]|nr:NAD(P)H-dependent oxidoreductase [Leptotrichiaceae bacterium]
MKTLVILVHPDIKGSKINKIWKQELEKYPDKITIHELYKEYPNWNINVKKEQELLEKYDRIILEFPLYWYSYPPLLKKWFDDVFTFGWAYGPNGNKMENKKISAAVSVGGFEKDYSKEGHVGFCLNTVLSPLTATVKFIRAEMFPHFTLFGTEHELKDEEIKESALKYAEYILNLK